MVTPRAEAEVRRLITRFAIERVAAGWSPWDLHKETGVNRSVIDRTETGATKPDLATLLTLAEPLGLRLDWVPPHLQPLLDLDEFEVAELLDAATEGWTLKQTGTRRDEVLTRVLQKLGKLTK